MLYSIGEKSAELGEGVYIAPSADVIGWVRLRDGANVWFNVVLRGDSDWIEVGEGSNVQDGTVIHIDPAGQGHPRGFRRDGLAVQDRARDLEP